MASLPMTKQQFRDPQDAFNAAIAAGTLSADPQSDRYAGRFMYMWTFDGVDQFKNRDTREYLRLEQTAAVNQ